MKHTIEIPEGFELEKISDTEYRIVKAELPNTWEEFCETHDVTPQERVIANASILVPPYESKRKRDKRIDRDYLPNQNYAEAILALCQLIQLRDCYRQGWKPDWTDASNKYCISFHSDSYAQIENISLHNIFSFQSEEIRNKFLDNFKDLLEIASYLWK